MPYFEFNQVDAFIECMKENLENQDESYLGPFWYDVNKKELFGVKSTPAEDCPWYHSSFQNGDVRTGRALHSAIWKKESNRGKDLRFRGDYKLTPRGRVFEIKDKGFVVYTGSWIYNHPEAKEEILTEFQLPESTEFKVYSHWDIGHGWSKELI